MELAIKILRRISLLVFIISTAVGKSFLHFFGICGQISKFTAYTLLGMVRKPFYWAEWIRHLWETGFYSLPVVGMTTLFSGMVLALQGSTRFSDEIALLSIPNLVVLAITRELSPVLAGLMVAGRIGAANAAEIATMRVSEQVDALITLSTPPMNYLVAPRTIAAALMMPLLVLVGDVIGIFGGWLVAVMWLEFPTSIFIQYAYDALDFLGVFAGLVKASLFGLIIAVVSCYFGYYCEEGAQGVGTATTKSVVVSAILILIANYLVTLLFFGVLSQ